MSYWELLGISPTDDITLIKKAYAEKSKLYHPETHPEQFQELHQAYKFLVAQCKRKKAMAEKAPTDNATTRSELETLDIPSEQITWDFPGLRTNRQNRLRHLLQKTKHPRNLLRHLMGRAKLLLLSAKPSRRMRTS